VAQCKAALGKTQGQEVSSELSSTVVASFAKYQAKAQAEYENKVVKTLLAKKAELEKELGDEIPLELPQEGGTTATVLVLHAKGVLAAWVGDSRAVAGIKEEGGEWRAEALSVDHSIKDPKERDRVFAAGGQTASKSAEDGKLAEMVCVPNAEGSLKVTRSLGDSPFHKNDVVSHVPDLSHRELSPSLRFVIACSDGVWDVLSDADAVRLVIERLEATNGGNTASGACAAVVQAVKAKSDDATPDDDVSVVVVVVRAKQ
jgi:serine/threonine protein phosphatase PrpC